MSATENKPEPRPYAVVAGVSMRDLLASCAAATAVSTPPRLPDPEALRPRAEHRKAA
ncbi:hypothetical protein OG252_21375 [Streptomyces sp. NBC_01352]|uniref:Uncharacterized protein n=1 Tax=Streptomyces plumbiresistens TaxID=511811 RepID=A0ABP7T6R6_9ACTN|nr:MULTISPECIES: hypothetical protein [unclassified Streptomyces]MCX4698537.1 hypothetical protein [Streptomyces sp. NBC_01373]